MRVGARVAAFTVYSSVKRKDTYKYMAGAFVSQLAISRIEVYNMYLTEKSIDAKKCLEKYYYVMGNLVEKFLIDVRGRLDIEGAVPITARNHAEYFRKLLFTLRAEYPQEPNHHLGIVRDEILGLVASTRQNLENLIV